MSLDLQTILSALFVVTTVASAICALTPTPPPDSALGKLYKVVEVLAGFAGKAKDSGLIKASPLVQEVDLVAESQFPALAHAKRGSSRIAEAIWALERKRWEAEVDAPVSPDLVAA